MSSATIEMGIEKVLDTPAEYDVWKVRADFPILTETTYGKPLVYLDNANTTQKPNLVLDALSEYYAEYNANVHRASHVLGARATEAYARAVQLNPSLRVLPEQYAVERVLGAGGLWASIMRP